MDLTAVDLTEVDLSRYAGGQIEIQNTLEEYLYRGEIGSIDIRAEDGHSSLVVIPKWMASMPEFPIPSGHWVATPPTEYGVDLRLYDSFSMADGRLCVTSVIFQETAILFPPSADPLDPHRVEGLEFVTIEQPVADLHVDCAFPVNLGGGRTKNCHKSARSAVLDPESGNRYYRCVEHEGWLDDGNSGEILSTVVRQTNEVVTAS